MWEDKFKDLSFGLFKRNFFGNKLKDFGVCVGEDIFETTILEIHIPKKTSFNQLLHKLNSFMLLLEDIFDFLRSQK